MPTTKKIVAKKPKSKPKPKSKSKPFRKSAAVASRKKKSRGGGGYDNNSQKNLSQMNFGNNSQKKNASQKKNNSQSQKSNNHDMDEDEDEDMDEDMDEDEEDEEDEEEDEDELLNRADNGNVNAKYILSTMTSKDKNERKVWLGKAADAGNKRAVKELDRIIERETTARKLLRTMWQRNEKCLFTQDKILDFVETVGNGDIIRHDNIFYKEEIIAKGLNKRDFTDDLLSKLPCQEYRHYMQNSVVSTDIDYAYILSESSDDISAVIFAELGECTEYPDFWTVRLICGKAGAKDARTLLGLYLFALKKIRQPVGILEVAQSYNNLAAYCLYAKFGFHEAYEYKQFTKCAKFTHMPLLNGLGGITENDIIQIVRNELTYENELCKKPISPAAQNAHIRNVLLPQWLAAGYNTSRFYRR